MASFCGIKGEGIKCGLGESFTFTFAHPEVSDAPEVPENEVQYDTDSRPDDAVESDNSDDTLTLLRAVTTHIGRAVQVRYFSL